MHSGSLTVKNFQASCKYTYTHTSKTIKSLLEEEWAKPKR